MSDEQQKPTLRPVLHDPEWCREETGHDAGWDLAWGARITFSDDTYATELLEDEPRGLHVTLSVSDDVQRTGIAVRTITVDQLRAHIEHLDRLLQVATARETTTKEGI